VAGVVGGQVHGRQAGDDLLEPLPVLASLDGVDPGPDQLGVVAGQDPGLVQFDRGVERGLPAQGGEHRVRPLDGDDLLQHVGGDRLHVGPAGEIGGGHGRGRIGVDQTAPDALGLEDPAGLGPGVVELAALPDDDRAGPDDEHGLQIIAARHQALLPWVVLAMWAQNSSNRSAASCGPGAASGWNWTLNTGRSSRRTPSTTPSFRLTWLTWAAPYGVSNGARAASGMCGQTVPPAEGVSPAWPGRAAAKPWLWLETRTRPVARSMTGWLIPRWPCRRWWVPRPRARARIWLPMQMPNTGTSAASTPCMASTA